MLRSLSLGLQHVWCMTYSVLRFCTKLAPTRTIPEYLKLMSVSAWNSRERLGNKPSRINHAIQTQLPIKRTAVLRPITWLVTLLSVRPAYGFARFLKTDFRRIQQYSRIQFVKSEQQTKSATDAELARSRFLVWDDRRAKI